MGFLVNRGTHSSKLGCEIKLYIFIFLLHAYLLLYFCTALLICVTLFGSHRRNTDRSLKVSISSYTYRHRSDLVRCGSNSRHKGFWDVRRSSGGLEIS